MTDFEAAESEMKKQFGHDVIMALATVSGNGTNVRNVDAYYKDGNIYITSHGESNKMKEIEKNSNVSLCRNLSVFWGKGENIGNPKEEKNSEIRNEVRNIFSAFYDRHVNENDPKTCILKVELTKALVFNNEAKYIINYTDRKAQKIPMKIDVVFEE
ncbi:MAG: pyridoxamine 5'-phosphate oxidase family protein [Thermotogae bacterium]|nr:pyridoxamine 5'-phosphate oxidase family protein [Thermotogota bacterium]MCP5465780.1 pyridoxamine 5'-phosphate oxidase family protein [Thermotogota bacterium]HOO75370.1 pyridoxamine 5'-phosphate oxidase family protein [Tepiditoga sp.]